MLYGLTTKGGPWAWGSKEEAAFHRLELLSTTDVLVHVDPSLPLGVACDASAVGIGATLFHHYSDGSEQPIANISKSLMASQRNYSHIQKEALAITIYALKKLFQYLYESEFVLVTDHQRLVALFGLNKTLPAFAANRLSQWAMFLRRFNYTIEYRKTPDQFSRYGTFVGLSPQNKSLIPPNVWWNGRN